MHFGLINLWGFVGSVGIYIFAYYRAKREMISEGLEIRTDDEINDFVLPENAPSFGKAVFPFLFLCIAFFAGFPVFLVGVASSIIVILMAKMSLQEGERGMITGVAQIAIPITAIISLMFMSTVIAKVGLVDLIATYVKPYISFASIQILFIISCVAGLITQSNAASAPIILPFVQILISMGCDPMAVSFAGITGAAIMQLFLTGGALTALPVVAGVIPGTNQKLANRWQRPAMLVGVATCFVLTFVV